MLQQVKQTAMTNFFAPQPGEKRLKSQTLLRQPYIYQKHQRITPLFFYSSSFMWKEALKCHFLALTKKIKAPYAHFFQTKHGADLVRKINEINLILMQKNKYPNPINYHHKEEILSKSLQIQNFPNDLFISRPTERLRESNRKIRKNRMILVKKNILHHNAQTARLLLSHDSPKMKVEKKSKKKEPQQLIDEYKKSFKWILYSNGAIFCSYCVKYCEEKAIQFVHETDRLFIKVGSTSIKKFNLNRHSQRKIHSLAILLYGSEEEKINAAIELNQEKSQDINLFLNKESKENKTLPIFRGILYLLKNDHSLNKLENLMSFLESNGLEVTPNYRNHVTASEISSHLSIWVRNSLIEEIKLSHTSGLQIDESMDISGKQILTVNIKYVNDGISKNKFLCCFELEGTDAETIYNQLKNKLNSFGVWGKVTSIATDGAPAFISQKKGVVGRLLEEKPYLFSIHCIAHRLNLGISDACKTDIYFKQINQLVFDLCKIFKQSPLKLRILDTLQEEILGINLHLIKPLDIRWLSHFRATKRILEIYPAIIATLTKLSKDSDFITLGLLKYLKDFLLLGHMHLLCDIHDIIEPLNLRFQQKEINLLEIDASLQIAKLSLEEFIHTDIMGKHLNSFLANISSNFILFHEIKIQISNQSIELIKKRKADVAKIVLKNLNERFSDLQRTKNLQIFDLRKLRKLTPATSEFFAYGKLEVNFLASIFTVDNSQLEIEWRKLKNFVIAYKEIESSEIWRNALNLEELKNLRIIISTFLTLPISTVECERVFSRMNLIKTESRSRLSTENLDLILNVVLNVNDERDVDFNEILQVWKNKKNRYFI